MKLPYGLVMGTCTVSLSSALSPLRSIGPSGVAPVSFPLTIRRIVKMTSSAVSGLPSWKVMPFRSLITQLDVEPCGLISSASTNSVWALVFSWSSGWYSDCARAVSRYVRPLCGSRVSEPDPPVRPTFRAPPRRLTVLVGEAAA